MKSQKKWSCVVAIFLMLLLAPKAWAEVVVVVASGTGISPRDAAKDSIRSAVEQVVGQLVDANTLVANEEVVSDKILTYSGGYVEGLEVVSPPTKGANGLFTTKIKARVKKTQLVEKLRAENVTMANVSGASLFAEMLTRQDGLTGAISILEENFKDVPLKFLTAGVKLNSSGMPAFDMNPGTGEISIPISLVLDLKAYNTWVKDVGPKLEKIAASSRRTTIVEDNTRYVLPNDIRQMLIDAQQGRNAVLMMADRITANSISSTFYIFNKDHSQNISELLDRHIMYFVAVTVNLLDGDGNSVGAGKVNLGYYQVNKGFVIASEDYYMIGPRIFYSADAEYDTVKFRTFGRGNPTPDRWDAIVKLGSYTPEILATISQVKCSVSDGGHGE